MPSNFHFLTPEWNLLYDRSKKAEEHALPDTRLACVLARMALELAIEIVYEKDLVLKKELSQIKERLEKKNQFERKPAHLSLNDLMKNEIFKRKIGYALKNKIHRIKNEGNNAVHNNDLKYNDPKIIVGDLYEFFIWFYNNYSENKVELEYNFNLDLINNYKQIKKLTHEELLDIENKLRKENRIEIEGLKKKIEILEKEAALHIKKYESLQTDFISLNKTYESLKIKYEELQALNSSNANYFTFQIQEVGITLQKDKIWGRVFFNFIFDQKDFYAIKYFAPDDLGKVKEKFLMAEGRFQQSELYNLFEAKIDGLKLEDVIKGSFDSLELVRSFDKKRFGTPSILVQNLLLDLKKQISFSNEDKEYVENGHYIIDFKEYMSIWTFKRKFNLNSINSVQQNYTDAINISPNVHFLKSKPDFGSFREIRIYPVESLKEYYDEYLPQQSNENHNSLHNRVKNFQGYYSACPQLGMEYGVHGPEEENGKVYLSLYHYFQFKGIDPRLYNTFQLGSYLLRQSDGDTKSCKYPCQNFSIKKFNISLLEKEENDFNRFLK